MDPLYVMTLAQEFNLASGITSQWPQQKPPDISNFDLDYSQQDQVLRFGAGAQSAVKGATCCWYAQLPTWVFDQNFNALQAPMEARIKDDLTHYKGAVPYWDVFNEVLDGDGSFRNRQKKVPNAASWVPFGYSYSPWVNGSDTSLIRAAFVKARQVDPAAKLYLNDYQNEQVGDPKAEAFYRLVAGMKKSGVPIDGVGFQLRFSINGNNVIWPQKSVDSFLQNVKASVKRYADLGVSVEFSEVEVGIRVNDIDFSTAAGKSLYAKRLADQAKVYGGLAKIAVESKNVSEFIIWLVSDRYPQNAVQAGYGDTSLLDTEYKPKPAYYAVLDALKQP
jgi:endo-1,4-beta-xylanase